MKWSRVLFWAALIYGAYQARGYFFPRHVPALSYTDVQGRVHDFSRLDKPAVIGFWIDECGYSQRVMSVLDEIREEYPADKLDVVGFYLNPRMDAEIAAVGAREGYNVTLAGAQESPGLIENLQKSFDIRGPGRDIYVIDKTGIIHTIKAVGGGGNPVSPGELESEVSARVKSALGA